jgi:hypothetical protein
MAFSGLSTNKLFTTNQNAEDVSEVLATLFPYEAPFLDWLGDSDRFAAASPKHEFIEDFLRPRYIIASTAISSATAATNFQINGLAEALTVGTLLENEASTAATGPELMQITSIHGPNTISVTRAYAGGDSGSLAPGGSLFVRYPAGIEGQEHSGAHTARLGNRRANTVGYFNVPIATTGTQMATNTHGSDNYEDARAKVFREIPGLLESEVLRGVLNASNSLGSPTLTRTMQGIRTQLTAINSAVAVSSFEANPHLYLGNVWEQVYQAGAGTDETWAIVAGRTFFRNISDLNDTKVQDSNDKEKFKRVIREYQGPFGMSTVFLSRALPATELLIVPRERVKVVPLQGRSFFYQEMGLSGDNKKGHVIGEYTVEVHHPAAMGRLRNT